MSWWTRILNSTWRQAEVERNAADELDAHLADSTTAFERGGLSTADARRAARQRLGLTGPWIAASVEQDTWTWLVTGLREARQAWRALSRRPALFATAVASLSGGLGLALVALVVVDAALVRALPFADADRLVVLNEHIEGRPTGGNPARVTDWDRELEAFAGVAGMYGEQLVLTHRGEARGVLAMRGIGPLGATLALAPAVGRPITDAEERNGAPVLLLTARGWRRLYSSSADVINSTVTLGGGTYTIVGVLPEHLDYPDDVDLFAPAGPGFQHAPRGGSWLQVIGRLAPGISIAQADANVRAVAASLAERHPEHDRGLRVDLQPLAEVDRAGVRPVLMLMLGAAGAVLLVVCMNVGGLLLVRAMTRDHETAVRAALGGSRWSIARTALHEAAWLSVAGLVGGWILAHGLLYLLQGTLGSSVPRLALASLAGRALLAGAALSVVVTGLLAAWPAWHASRRRGGPGVAAHAVTDTRDRRWPRQVLVAVQVACTTILLVLALLFGRSLTSLVEAPRGFSSMNVIALRYDLEWERSKADVDAFATRVVDAVSMVPGVRVVGMGDRWPLQGGTQSTGVQLFGEDVVPASRADIAVRTVSAEYFVALDVPVLRGRLFGPGLGPLSQDDVVINETFARMHFGRLDVVGERIALRWSDAAPRWRSIVGVVADVRQSLRQQSQPAEVYQPWARGFWPLLHVAVRTDAGTGLAVLPRVRERLQHQIPDVPIAELSALDTTLGATSRRDRVLTRAMSVAAVASAVLALVGVYGLTAGDLQTRRREIGIRLALGARPWPLRARLLRGHMLMTAGASAVGLVGSVPAAQAVASQLYGVGAMDAGAMVTAVVALSGAAMAAGLVPACRMVGARTLAALRYE